MSTTGKGVKGRRQQQQANAETNTVLKNRNGDDEEDDDKSQWDDDVFARSREENKMADILPMIEDLVFWINKVLKVDIEYTPPESFFAALSTGSVVCQLANLVQEATRKKPIRFRSNATSQSFFARDNAANFLNFCMSLNMSENILFESECLVSCKSPRNIILVLLELGRIFQSVGLEPPNLVKFETEIDEGDDDSSSVTTTATSSSSCCDTGINPDSPPPLTAPLTSRASRPKTPSRIPKLVRSASGSRLVPRQMSLPITNGPPGSRRASVVQGGNKKPDVIQDALLRFLSGYQDRSVFFQLKRISDGKYRLRSGKVIFIRLLNGRHLMVRVGGGWETLQIYLEKHEPEMKLNVAEDVEGGRIEVSIRKDSEKSGKMVNIVKKKTRKPSATFKI